MHPPRFLITHALSDWPLCSIELRCCKGTVVYPVRLLVERHGDMSFENLLSRLRCERCRFKPAPVYLCAGHRTWCGGAPADWCIELVPPREEKATPARCAGR